MENKPNTKIDEYVKRIRNGEAKKVIYNGLPDFWINQIEERLKIQDEKVISLSDIPKQYRKLNSELLWDMWGDKTNIKKIADDTSGEIFKAEAERRKAICELLKREENRFNIKSNLENSNKLNWLKNLDYIRQSIEKLENKDEKLQWLVDNNLIEPFSLRNINQNYLKTIKHRVVVKVKIGDIRIPFYISTGYGMKANVESNKWYVFFGQGKNGWFNKTNGNDMNNQYGVEVFKKIASILNSVGSDKDEYKPIEDEGGSFDIKSTSELEDELKNLIDFIDPVNIKPDLSISPEDYEQLKANIQKVRERVEEEINK